MQFHFHDLYSLRFCKHQMMYLFCSIYLTCFLLVLTSHVHSKISNIRKNENVRWQKEVKKKKLDSKVHLEYKNYSSEIKKRQLLYPPFNVFNNYPFFKPPPIRHFVVHHHASEFKLQYFMSVTERIRNCSII